MNLDMKPLFKPLCLPIVQTKPIGQEDCWDLESAG